MSKQQPETRTDRAQSAALPLSSSTHAQTGGSSVVSSRTGSDAGLHGLAPRPPASLSEDVETVPPADIEWKLLTPCTTEEFKHVLVPVSPGNRAWFTLMSIVGFLPFRPKADDPDWKITLRQAHVLIVLACQITATVFLVPIGVSWSVISAGGVVLSICNTVIYRSRLIAGLLRFMREYEANEEEGSTSQKVQLMLMGTLIVWVPTIVFVDYTDNALFFVGAAITSLWNTLAYLGTWLVISIVYQRLEQISDSIGNQMAEDVGELIRRKGPSALTQLSKEEALLKRWAPLHHRITQLLVMEQLYRLLAIAACVGCWFIALSVVIEAIVVTSSTAEIFQPASFLIISAVTVCSTNIGLRVFAVHSSLRRLNQKIGSVLNQQRERWGSIDEDGSSEAASTIELLELPTSISDDVAGRQGRSQTTLSPNTDTPSIEDFSSYDFTLMKQMLFRVEEPEVPPTFRNLLAGQMHAVRLAGRSVLAIVLLAVVRIAAQYPSCVSIEAVHVGNLEDESVSCSTAVTVVRTMESFLNLLLIVTMPYAQAVIIRGGQRLPRSFEQYRLLPAFVVVLILRGLSEVYHTLFPVAYSGGYILVSVVVAYGLGKDLNSTYLRNYYMLLQLVYALIGFVFLLVCTPAFIEGAIDPLLLLFVLIPAAALLFRQATMFLLFRIRKVQGIKTEHLYWSYGFMSFGVQCWQRLYLAYVTAFSTQAFAVIVWASIEVFSRGSMPFRYYWTQRLVFGVSPSASWARMEHYMRDELRHDLVFMDMVTELASIIVAYMSATIVPEVYGVVRRDNVQWALLAAFALQLVVELGSELAAMFYETNLLGVAYLKQWKTRSYSQLWLSALFISAVVARAFYLLGYQDLTN